MTVAARPTKPRPSLALALGLVVTVGITWWAASSIHFTLMPLITDIGRGKPVLDGFLHPNWSFAWRVRSAWLETLYIAIIASAIGCSIALVMALLASKMTAPPAVVQVTKILLSLIRSLPDVAWGLLFVAAVGSGALAGISALIIFNIGIAAKLTAETVDAIDPGPLEAADAAGATRIQRARVAAVPQVLPNYLSYSLYVFELNVRASVVIGLVGAGGIGQVINVQLSRFSYENLSAIILALFVVVLLLDQLSRFLRRRLV
ncbi:MAG TPA: phosphonate ABC transporter, permease protein PhnE [Intrasporangiaceae bacterium]|nr:phosphonate ABC transporter, permease protein PhnE [Intrasporangiaceae bacterium]